MAYKVKFFIIDREYRPVTKYDYIGYFQTQAEVMQFVKENVRAGNSIDVVNCWRVSKTEYMEMANRLYY